jgi:hypothetical protein
VPTHSYSSHSGSPHERGAWRPLDADDLSCPETPVRVNGRFTGKTVADYADLSFPGSHPYLLGLASLVRVEVPRESPSTGDGSEPGGSGD